MVLVGRGPFCLKANGRGLARWVGREALLGRQRRSAWLGWPVDQILQYLGELASGETGECQARG